MAHWLIGSGFPRVAVLAGGLGAWREAGLPVDTRLADHAPVAAADAGAAERGVLDAFLPSLADRYLRAGTLPARRRLATLYVDIAGSTRLLAHHPPETVLGVVQRFLRLVTEVALAYCGDVKDYEGDGALLYFESPADAVRAALAIRAALACGRCGSPAETTVTARMSLTLGDVVVGVVGTSMRRAMALVGPSVSVGSRLLKQVAPGGIIAGGEVIEALRGEAPQLAEGFRLVDPAFPVPGADGITVATWVAEPPAP